MNLRSKNKPAFTLIELLVVIAIISLLSSVVLANLSSARESARNSQRRQTLNQVQAALELYYNDNKKYPVTDTSAWNGGSDVVYGDPTCDFSNSSDVAQKEWIPGLVSSGYIEKLPQDPTGVDQARDYDSDACYLYLSDGDDYIVSAWSTVEGGLVDTDDTLYSRAGYRETSLNDPGYYCNHSNIGDSPDHYRYSYTITTKDCSW